MTFKMLQAHPPKLHHPKHLLPLHWLQAELMLRRRALAGTAAEADMLRHDRALMVTMTGIAAGMRNTG